MTCSRCSRGWAHLHVTEVLRRAGLLDTTWASPEAMQRGTCVHQAIALGDDLDESTIDPVWAGYYCAWQSWRREMDAEILLAEVPVSYRALGFAGTLDAVARIGGQTWLVDYKTGGLPSSVGPQTAAYRMAANATTITEAPILHRACLQLKEDGTYRWVPQTDRHDESVFRAALTVAQWQVTHGL